MAPDPGVLEAARRWAAGDVDERCRAELHDLADRAASGDTEAAAELDDRMSGPLTFGTAGLRGPLRAGPNGINRAVVARTTAGVARWLEEHGHTGARVLVGRDARHGSAELATEAAGVLCGAGLTVSVFDEPVPTPVLAFAVRDLGAAAGIQITASHNPASDNGYKLYDASGAQIVPPADAEISASIEAAPEVRSLTRSRAWDRPDPAVVDRYVSRAATMPRGTARGIRVALTPLHGVGADTAVAALHHAGFDDVVVVAEQAEPDPDFPTVPYPNPEEAGACDRLLELAASCRADLAVALDPDADRCALGIPTRHDSHDVSGGFRMLTGDETGTLLGEHVLASLDRARHPDPVVATTIVSSSALAALARAHRASYAETLTGFKWLVRAAGGDRLVYAYEEALGVCADPAAVRDKDGITAAVLAADLAASRKAAGSSIGQMLDELATEHGVYLTAPVTVRVRSSRELPGIMRQLRSDPPRQLAGRTVTIDDLLPGSDTLRLTGAGVRVVVRPSGTEPKIKAYLEVVEPPPEQGSPEALQQARRVAANALSALHADTRALLEG
ncbi:phosphomannomutase [Haloechinothrix alba]|uniref:Phosphomannomutase n=1 Tax=Haloechinothrix alba TaxID=664784 RepID=A0A238VV98_9PSEU|nr:phospho-sugar mutase [Haloechinothrix alba]SNR38262.1 phosphomannomutase [Haloechinothrix alba]